MKNKHRVAWVLKRLGGVLLLLMLTTACKRKKKPDTITEPLSLSTSGAVTLYVDESYQPLLTSAEFVFENLYKDAEVDLHFVTEAEAIQRFLNAETPVTFLARKLSDAELKSQNERGFRVQQLVIARDAVAFVVNESNPDSFLTQNQMIDLVGGKIKSWSDVSSTNPSGNVNVVFQKNNSSTATFIRDSVLNGNALPSNSYALESHQEVMKYVRENSGAVGVVALNWISDKNDPEVLETLSGLRVLSISLASEPNAFYHPNRANIREKHYPFTRSVYMINGEGRTGLGTGFASYLASDPGMTLIERFGLVSYKDPVRVIETRKTFDN